jgi:hypothetical protein
MTSAQLRVTALFACALGVAVSASGCLGAVDRVFADLDGGGEATDATVDGATGSGQGDGAVQEAPGDDSAPPGDANAAADVRSADAAGDSGDATVGQDAADATSVQDAADANAAQDAADATSGSDAADAKPGQDAADATPGPDAGDGGTDAASDATTADAAPGNDAAGTPDAADAAGGIDAANPAVVYACGGSKVSDCSSCGGKPEKCVFCLADGGVTGACTMAGANCFYALPAGAYMCPCVTSSSVCPMSWQWCEVGYSECHTCGETGSGLKPCKVGTCNEPSAVCQ